MLAVRLADERSRVETERICVTSLPNVAVGAGDASLTDAKDVTSAQLSVVSRSIIYHKQNNWFRRFIYCIYLFNSEAICEGSPLRQEMALKPRSKAAAGCTKSSMTSRTAGKLDKRGAIVDGEPITFRSKIKSSGYAREQPK